MGDASGFWFEPRQSVWRPSLQILIQRVLQLFDSLHDISRRSIPCLHINTSNAVKSVMSWDVCGATNYFAPTP